MRLLSCVGLGVCFGNDVLVFGILDHVDKPIENLFNNVLSR